MATGPGGASGACPVCGAETAAGVPCPACGASGELDARAVPTLRLGPSDHAQGRPADAPAAPSGVPERLGPYRILEEIGRGGMGVVYRARQESLKRDVALKVLASGAFASPEDVKRFLREAEHAARLEHRNIVPVLDLGEHEGRLFFTMAFVKGGSLADRIEAGTLPRREAARILERVAAAVAYAHGRGIIHRDLKPANVLLGEDGEPLVTDFGLAARLGPRSSLSGTGQILGTPYYMAPEQARGDLAAVDARSDVYSLGATLYELASGRPPFSDPSDRPLMLRVIADEPRPLRRVDASIPRDLEVICHKALAKEKERRYQTAEALRRDLAAFLDGAPIAARPASVAYRVGKALRRHRTLAVLSSVAAVLAATLLVQGLRQISRERSAWQVAFQDRFARRELGPEYVSLLGEWGIRDGALEGGGPGISLLALAPEFPGDVRVELEATVLPGSGKAEVAMILGGAERGADGYYVGFGGDYQRVALDRQDLEVRLLPSPPVEPGRPYRLVLTRQGPEIRLDVDSETLLGYVDPVPLGGAGTSVVKIGTFDGRLRIGSIRVSQAGVPEVMPATVLGDRLFERGNPDAALAEYRRIADQHRGRPIGGEALYKMGLCHAAEGRTDEALARFAAVSGSSATPFFKGLARLAEGKTLALAGRRLDALAHLAALEPRVKDADERYRLAEALGELSELLYRNGEDEPNAILRRFVTERFPGLPVAERSALALATTAGTAEELERRLETFLREHPRTGKLRWQALTYLVAIALARGDVEKALEACAMLERDFQGKNARFVLDGRYARALSLATAGRTEEALDVARTLPSILPGDPHPHELALQVAALVERLEGRSGEAVEIVTGCDAASDVERALVARECGDVEAERRLLEAALHGPDPGASRAAAYLLGFVAPEQFRRDAEVPFPLRQRTYFDERRLAGEPAECLRIYVTDPFEGVTPLFCRGVRVSWALRGLPMTPPAPRR